MELGIHRVESERASHTRDSRRAKHRDGDPVFTLDPNARGRRDERAARDSREPVAPPDQEPEQRVAPPGDDEIGSHLDLIA